MHPTIKLSIPPNHRSRKPPRQIDIAHEFPKNKYNNKKKSPIEEASLAAQSAHPWPFTVAPSFPSGGMEK